MYWAVVPAAGTGQRLPGDRPKQYRMLAGASVLDHCLHALLQHPRMRGVMLALAADDEYWPQSRFADDPRVHTCIGGGERADSVLAALLALRDVANGPQEEEGVLVHDAARALLPAAALQRLLDAPLDEQGAILALPAQDTLKQQDGDGRISRTLDRSIIWQAQTPQLFRYGLLREELRMALNSGCHLTDEASCMERVGYHPRLIPGDALNFKITTPADFRLARALLEQT